jgi:hypothetical protein
MERGTRSSERGPPAQDTSEPGHLPVQGEKKSTMSRMSGSYIAYHFEVAIEGNVGLQHHIH